MLIDLDSAITTPMPAFTVDEAADTLRFVPESDPEETSFYSLPPPLFSPLREERRTRARRRQIRATRQDIAGLRDAIAAGWNVGPELAHEERRLAALETADRRSGR